LALVISVGRKIEQRAAADNVLPPIAITHGRTRPMKIELSSQKEFDRLIEQGVSLIDFNASWCAPCRAQNVIIDDLDRRYAEKAHVVTVDIDQNRNIASNLGIQSIPTIIIFKDGWEKARFIGLQTTETLDKALKEALAR
jgi:thioredoxin 1